MKAPLFPALLLVAAAFAASAPFAAAQAGPPQQVRARIAALDARCRAAGGQPIATQPYIYVHDYTGDGTKDYLVSEGNYGCAGRPGLFRASGAAVIEVYAVQPGGSAVSVYRDSVMAYRLVDRTPTLIQIAKTGAGCAGAAPCGFSLQWDAGARRLREVPTGAAAPVAAPAVPAASRSQAQVLAECRAAKQRRGMAARDITPVCAEEWGKLDAALPMARAIVAMMAQPAALRTAAGVKAALPTVRWSAAGARGTLGALAVTIEGRAAIDRIAFGWSEQGGLIPYDLPAALRYLGAGVTPIACGTGGGAFGDERTRSLRVEAGAGPFELRIEERDAAVAIQDSTFAASLRPGAPIPTYAALRATTRSRDPIEYVQWSASCPP